MNVLKPFDVRVVLPSQSCAGDRHRRFGTPNGACVKGVRSSVQGGRRAVLGWFSPRRLFEAVGEGELLFGLMNCLIWLS